MEENNAILKQLLSSCQLDSYLEKFIDNCINDDALKLLDDEGLRDLIPIVGHRMKFKEALKCWKLHNESILGSVNLSDLDVYIPVENIESPATEPSKNNADGDSRPTILNEDTLTNKTDKPISPYVSDESSNSDGKAILAEGQRTGGLLKESDRKRLSQIIVLHLLEYESARVISSCVFKRISTEINHLFPKESSLVYYSPYESDNKGHKKNASGKLYETYISRRRKLRSRGELPGTSRSSSSASTATDITLTNSSSEHEDDTCQEKLAWLKNSVEPWHMVEEYWAATSKIRLEPIRLGVEKSTIDEYLRTYPALQQPQGYTLLLQDFETLYGEKKDGLYSNIVLLREKIIALSQDKLNRTRDKDIKKTITDYINLANESDPETLTNVALILLTYLAGSTQILRKGKKTHWKPSRSEIRDGFITQAASEAEVTSIIQTRQEKLQRLGRTMQPFIIFVGESVAKVRTAYVIVNNTCYNFVKLITAVDATFKIFQATGAQYPEESMDIWVVIQLGFYKIKTVFDRTTQSSTSLLNDLELL